MNAKFLKTLSDTQNPLMAEKELLECLVVKHMFENKNVRRHCVLAGSMSLTAAQRPGKAQNDQSNTHKNFLRLSNDIDFAITDFQELSPNRTKNNLNDFKDHFKNSVFMMKSHIDNMVKPIGKFDIYTDREVRDKSQNGRKYSYPEIHLYYQSQLNNQHFGHINLEFMPRHYNTDVIEYRAIVPYSLQNPISEPVVPTVCPTQTFWDKCYALHTISTMGIMRPGLAHHYYDVACIYDTMDLSNATKYLNSIVQYQQIYTTRKQDTGLSVEQLRLVPSPDVSAELSKDYQSIQNTFIKTPESWESIIKTIQIINNKLVNHGHQK